MLLLKAGVDIKTTSSGNYALKNKALHFTVILIY